VEAESAALVAAPVIFRSQPSPLFNQSHPNRDAPLVSLRPGDLPLSSSSSTSGRRLASAARLTPSLPQAPQTTRVVSPSTSPISATGRPLSPAMDGTILFPPQTRFTLSSAPVPAPMPKRIFRPSSAFGTSTTPRLAFLRMVFTDPLLPTLS